MLCEPHANFLNTKDEETLPPIKVKIFKTNMTSPLRYPTSEAGFLGESSGKVFNYMYSTAPKVHILRVEALMALVREPSHARPRIRGLPQLGCTCNYFNGDLQIASVDGHGTNVCLSPERVPPGPGKHPRVQREVQQETQDGDSGRRLDG